jgi:hypothetical protein
MKKILFFALMSIQFNLAAQQTVLPMKGSYIFYEFKETTANTTRPILEFFTVLGKGPLLFQTLTQKYLEFSLNSSKSGIKDMITISFMGCYLTDRGEPLQQQFGSGQYLIIGSSKFSNLIYTGLGKILNVKKKKVRGFTLKADVIIKIHSKNEYSLIFSNFKYHTSYEKSNMLTIPVIVEAEELMKVIKDEETTHEYVAFLNSIMREVAVIFQKELKRLYEIDNH